MKKIVIALFSIFTLVDLAEAQQSPDLKAVERILDDYVQNEEIPSTIIGIVNSDGLQHVIARGETKWDSGIPVDKTTGYQIASLSKSFTSIIFNSLFEKEIMSPLDSITSYLRGEIPDSALDKFSNVTIKDFKTYMRLKDFLQHRAGLPNNGASVPPTPNGAPMLGGYSEEGMIKDLTEFEINQEMINRFSYSNFGYAVLGHILEKATGKSYEALLNEYVTDVYGLEFTTSILNEESHSKLATPYHVGDRKKETKPWEMGKSIPGGGILSNIKDLSRLMSAQIKAYQDYLKKGQESKLILTKEKKSIGPNMYYGYGFIESRNPYDSTIVQFGHSGDVDGFGSFYEIYPSKDIGLIILTSSGGSWFNELKNTVERALLGQPVRKHVSLPKNILKRYTGKYDFGKDQIMTIFRKGDELRTFMRGWGSMKLYSESETSFYYRSMNAGFKFEVDENGELTKVIYQQNGKEIYPKKIK